jgi:hypothetical protein
MACVRVLAREHPEQVEHDVRGASHAGSLRPAQGRP